MLLFKYQVLYVLLVQGEKQSAINFVSCASINCFQLVSWFNTSRNCVTTPLLCPAVVMLRSQISMFYFVLFFLLASTKKKTLSKLMMRFIWIYFTFSLVDRFSFQEWRTRHRHPTDNRRTSFCGDTTSNGLQQRACPKRRRSFAKKRKLLLVSENY